MKSIRWGRALAAAALLSLALIYSILFRQTLRDPSQRTGSDFIAFYTAGRVAHQFGAAQVYQVPLQQTIQQELVGFTLAPGQVLLYNHLPFLIPILQIISTQSYVTAFVVWDSLLLALYVLTIYLLVRSSNWDASSSALIWFGGLTFFPLFVSLLNGQDSAFLVLGAALCFCLLPRERDFFAGLGLSLAIVRPQIALLLIVPFLFKRRGVLIGFMLGAGLLAALSAGLLGLAGTEQFIRFLLLTAGGKWYGIKEAAMFNLIGILARAAPEAAGDAIHLIGWGAYALAGLAVAWSAWKRSSLDIQFLGSISIVSLFLAPHLHYHDLALLLIAVFAVLNETKHPSLPLIFSVILLIGFTPPLRYWIAYLVMAILFFALTRPASWKSLTEGFQKRFSSRRSEPS